MHTSGIENDVVDGSIDQDGEIARVSGGKKFSGGVAATESVEDGAAEFGAVNVIEGEAVEGRDAGVEKAVPHRSLPS